MPRSVSLHPDYRETARLALERKGFLTQGDLAANLETALSTVSNFFNCKAISIAKFEKICEALDLDKRAIIQPAPTGKQTFSPILYNRDTWVGREVIVKNLLTKLQGQTRILWITGISGIGKTTLGECLASKAWESDPSFQCIYLEVLEGQSADFTGIAAELLAKLGDKDLDLQERNDPKRLTERLLRKLQTNRYWVQLDALERLLNPEQPTEFSDAHWIAFLQRCLTEAPFASHFVLTAQALPIALAEFSDRYPNQWYEITLRGLSVDEQHNESLELFSKNSITVDESNKSILNSIGQIYEGHPLVLQVVAKEIAASPFNGEVATYWECYSDEFEQVARELQIERVNPANHSQALQRQVRRRVEISLKRLPADALNLLYRSSVYRRPVPEIFWLAMVGEQSSTQQQEAYRVLSEHALIEREIHQGKLLIRQHNLIRDVAYGMLEQDTSMREFAERKAADMWLMAYEPSPNAFILEGVRGQLEAFEHYYNIRDWKKAVSVVQFPLDVSPKRELHRQLKYWGQHTTRIYLYKKCLDYVDLEVKCTFLRGLGQSFQELGKYADALNFYRRSLEIAEAINDLKSQEKAYLGLGEVCAMIGYSNTRSDMNHYALEYYMKSLKSARSRSDKAWEAQTLNSLGKLYESQKDISKAFRYYQKAFAAANSIDNEDERKFRLSFFLINFGVLVYYQNNYLQAINLFEQSLEIARYFGDCVVEVKSLNGLGRSMTQLKRYEEASICLNKALKLARKVTDESLIELCRKNLTKLQEAKDRS